MKAKSFTCFRRLPLELRTLIWKHASFHSRNVDITASYAPDKLSDTWDFISLEDVFYYLSVCPPPVVLQVNKESRSEALKWYSLGFGTTPTFSLPENEVKPHIYINWDVDRVILVEWGLLRWLQLAQRDFREMCKGNGLRFLACNLKGGIVERHVKAIFPEGVELEEVGFFNWKGVFYEGMREKRVVLEERRMVQMGAYKEIVDAVVVERTRRVAEMDLTFKGDDQGSAASANSLVVKLVRLVQ